MADTHETIADIIAWLRRPREGENAYLTLWRDEIADRLEAAHKRECGNVAKLREALTKILNLTNSLDENCAVDPVEIRDIAKAALAAPPRNCDIGSAEGQYARFVAVCHANVDLTGRCRESCSFRRVPAEYKCDRAECFARWAQLPYKEGGAR